MLFDKLVNTCGDLIRPDGTRTVLRPFHVADPASEEEAKGRTAHIVDRVLSCFRVIWSMNCARL